MVYEQLCYRYEKELSERPCVTMLFRGEVQAQRVSFSAFFFVYGPFYLFSLPFRFGSLFVSEAFLFPNKYDEEKC